MKRISLICVYNDRELMNAMVQSCRAQTIGEDTIDFVLIDNTSACFSSAASALNHGAQRALADTLLFLHQDIEFVREDALEYIVQYLAEDPTAVIGAAGVRHKEIDSSGAIVSSMHAGPGRVRYSHVQDPQEAFVLDECLFGCRRSAFSEIRFDEEICNAWHLYAADLCLQARLKGMHVVVLPLEQVWHKSHGNADRNYYRTQNELAKKYRRRFRVINTTNGYVYTDPIKRFLCNLYRTVKYRKNHM